MAPQLPSWLDEEFVKSALQGGDDKEPKVTIVNFTANPAVSAGENYQSMLFRVQVEYNTGDAVKQSASLVVKAPLTQGLASLPGMVDNFGKERTIYKELLPKMYEKVKYQFGPKIFHSAQDNVLVLQDLKAEGYVMCDRLKQLDFPHCQEVMKTIAKFHASSVALHQEDPNFVKKVSEETMYRDDSPLGAQMKMMMGMSLQFVAGILAKTEGCEKYAGLLMSKVGNVWNSSVENFKPKENGLNVLTHGDLWTNNMMFNHSDSGDITDLKLIDFPVIRYNSPATDLAFFIWSSANEEVREHKLGELNEMYLQTLNSTLEQLGCEERLTEEELKKDIRGLADWLLFLICQFLPLVLSDPTDALNVEDLNIEDLDLSKPEMMFGKMFQGKLFQAALPTVLRQYETWVS